MSGPLYLPTSPLVAAAWLRLAVAGPGVGEKLPAVDVALQTAGFIRVTVAGGNPERFVPMHAPVVSAECWVAPGARSKASWRLADQLGARVWQATFDRELMGVLVDLSGVGDYRPARVHTVTALTEPERVEDDPNSFARVDVDLDFLWSST